MKYLIFACALVFVGCDVLGLQSAGQRASTITYRVDTSDAFPLGPSAAVNYFVDGGYQGRSGITEFPWEVTIPYFDGPKGVFVMAASGDATVSILHNGKVIAKSELTSVGGEVPNFIQLGAIAHAERYEISAHLTSDSSVFDTNFLSRESVEVSEDGTIIMQDSLWMKPGEVLELSKSSGSGVAEVRLSNPAPMVLLSTGGMLSSAVSIQLGALK